MVLENMVDMIGVKLFITVILMLIIYLKKNIKNGRLKYLTNVFVFSNQMVVFSIITKIGL